MASPGQTPRGHQALSSELSLSRDHSLSGDLARDQGLPSPGNQAFSQVRQGMNDGRDYEDEEAAPDSSSSPTRQLNAILQNRYIQL